MPEYETSSIGEMRGGEYHLRGTPISQLIHEADLVSTIWFAWTGTRPDDATRKLLAACFVACVDHGAKPPSAAVARTVASCGKPLADAVAAGLLTLGPRHGNAAGLASAWVRNAVAAQESAESVARRAIESRERLAGIGHPEYTQDPRAETLYQIARTTLSATPHTDFLREVADEMSRLKSTTLPVNVDGAVGAVIAELHAPPDLADAIFLVSRSIGLIAHAREEAQQASSYRRG